MAGYPRDRPDLYDYQSHNGNDRTSWREVGGDDGNLSPLCRKQYRLRLPIPGQFLLSPTLLVVRDQSDTSLVQGYVGGRPPVLGYFAV